MNFEPLAGGMNGRVNTGCEVKMNEQTITSGSELAGVGAAGALVRRAVGEELWCIIAHVGAVFPERNGQTSESMAF
jgi:hypothetical protein